MIVSEMSQDKIVSIRSHNKLLFDVNNLKAVIITGLIYR